jgi:hypothetical protein
MMNNQLNILILSLITFFSSCYAQKLNQKTIDEKKHYEILIGQCNREGFATCKFDSAYQAGYSAYAPDMVILNQCPPYLADVTITLVMGTWCGDSKEHVPHFYKILDLLKFDIDKLNLICVDRLKKAPGVDLTQLNIQLVPTFIFYRKDKEIGRIIETPVELMEKDMLRIISGN